MGSSAKKKKEIKKDFQKAKLKVGKARPKNTNATDTSFAAKSIVFKQQSLSESSRDARTLFEHNLSLLSSKNETQRRDALQFLTTALQTLGKAEPPLPAAQVLAKAQPLLLDGSSQVRQQCLRLLRALPASQLGSLDPVLLYTRAGMAHLADGIKLSSLDALDWLLETNGAAVVCSAGGWMKTLRTFQSLLAWHGDPTVAAVGGPAGTKWSNAKPATSSGSSALLVHQLNTLARFLVVGLSKPDIDADRRQAALRAAATFPLWHLDVHLLSNERSNPFGYLNLFGTPRDVESEVYDDPRERGEVMVEDGLLAAFQHGVREAKKEAGEVGRAAAAVEKRLRLAEAG